MNHLLLPRQVNYTRSAWMIWAQYKVCCSGDCVWKFWRVMKCLKTFRERCQWLTGEWAGQLLSCRSTTVHWLRQTSKGRVTRRTTSATYVLQDALFEVRFYRTLGVLCNTCIVPNRKTKLTIFWSTDMMDIFVLKDKISKKRNYVIVNQCDQTCSSLSASLLLIHVFPCPCGSMRSG